MSACSDSSAYVWDTQDGTMKHKLQGHYLDVNRCLFFPSNEVILTAGSDMQIKIWSAIDGSCPVTLLGHTRAVTDLAIIDRGKNVLSVGKDGVAKLWSCGQGACLENVFDLAQELEKMDLVGVDLAINCCALQAIQSDSQFDLGQRGEEVPSEFACGTENKLLVVGTESGHVFGVGVHSKKVLFHLNIGSPVNALAFISADHFAVGTQQGRIHLVDIHHPSQPRLTWNYTNSSVLSLLGVSHPSLAVVVGHHDGSVYYLREGDEKVVVCLTGSDCDPIYQLASDGRSIYTACRDGRVRKYLLENAF